MNQASATFQAHGRTGLGPASQARARRKSRVRRGAFQNFPPSAPLLVHRPYHDTHPEDHTTRNGRMSIEPMLHNVNGTTRNGRMSIEPMLHNVNGT
eukprot:CAMPEP_0204307692 /NCGR_PEP_ID=MMETSP0469-20131031/68_1 /ASSEMBLY_ACC=CAM_ASM_000384 /TAXON_ID=2969 /ORGANISM="Oxyrrhis marina" /LENGTH=95 /DNA_ID=CAMNT_0051287069 /DNA_START=65 /DNA_END=349 /DNA_ORIENTATION=-